MATEEATGVIDASKLPVTYSATEAVLADLRDRLSGLTIGGLDDKDGYEIVRKGIREVVSLRTGVDKERKALKAGALEYGKRVDDAAKKITADLVAIEEPLKAEKAVVDEEKERAKAEKEAAEKARADRIQGAIEKIRNAPMIAANATAEQIEEAIRMLTVHEDDLNEENFAEFLPQAQETYRKALAALREAHTARLEHEAELTRIEKEKERQAAEDARLRKEREKLDRDKAEQEERAQAERDAAERERIEEQAKLDAEREKIATEKREFEEAKAEEERKQERERIETEAKEKAEKDAAERAEREKAEKEEIARLAEIEAKRVEAMKPDREKLEAWVRGPLFDTWKALPAPKEPELAEIVKDAGAKVESLGQDVLRALGVEL